MRNANLYFDIHWFNQATHYRTRQQLKTLLLSIWRANEDEEKKVKWACEKKIRWPLHAHQMLNVCERVRHFSLRSLYCLFVNFIKEFPFDLWTAIFRQRKRDRRNVRDMRDLLWQWEFPYQSNLIHINRTAFLVCRCFSTGSMSVYILFNNTKKKTDILEMCFIPSYVL